MKNLLICLFFIFAWVELFSPKTSLGVVALIDMKKINNVQTETGMNGEAVGSSSEEIFFEDDEEGEEEEEEGEGEEEEEEEEGEEEDYLEVEEQLDISKGFLVDFHNDFKDEVISLYWKSKCSIVK